MLLWNSFYMNSIKNGMAKSKTTADEPNYAPVEREQEGRSSLCGIRLRCTSDRRRSLVSTF